MKLEDASLEVERKRRTRKDALLTPESYYYIEERAEREGIPFYQALQKTVDEHRAFASSNQMVQLIDELTKIAPTSPEEFERMLKSAVLLNQLAIYQSMVVSSLLASSQSGVRNLLMQYAPQYLYPPPTQPAAEAAEETPQTPFQRWGQRLAKRVEEQIEAKLGENVADAVVNQIFTPPKSKTLQEEMLDLLRPGIQFVKALAEKQLGLPAAKKGFSEGPTKVEVN